MSAGWFPDPAHQGFLRFWDGYQWTAAVVASPQPTRQRPFLGLGCVVVALGLLQIVGSLLPWATALGGLIQRSGVADASDGWATLIAGVLTCIWGSRLIVGSERRWMGIALAAITTVCALVAFADLSDITEISGASVGSGLVMVTLTGPALAVTGAIRAFTRAPQPQRI